MNTAHVYAAYNLALLTPDSWAYGIHLDDLDDLPHTQLPHEYTGCISWGTNVDACVRWSVGEKVSIGRGVLLRVFPSVASQDEIASLYLVHQLIPEIQREDWCITKGRLMQRADNKYLRLLALVADVLLPASHEKSYQSNVYRHMFHHVVTGITAT